MVYWEGSALIEATEAMIRGSINHPAHYQLDNGMEAIDVIRGVLGDKGYKDFCRGNALKYLCRAGKKGLITDDLKKAAWYVTEEIKQYEGMDDE